jgi:hypothetical protein
MRELPGPHRRRADVERLARAHDVAQRLDGLFDRRVGIEAMDLIEVDIIRAEALQRGVDPLHDVLARQAAGVRPRPHRVEHLRGDHDLVAPGEFLDRPAENFLAGARRINIGVVEEVDPALEGALDERARSLLVEHPLAPFRRAIGHATQAQFRHFHAGLAKAYEFHGRQPLGWFAPQGWRRIARGAKIGALRYRLAAARAA